MLSLKQIRSVLIELIIPWSVLGFLVLNVFGQLFLAPYIGFDFEPGNGRISDIFTNPAGVDMKVDDELQGVNGISLDQYKADLRTPWFPRMAAGDLVELTLVRDKKTHQVSWETPGFTLAEFRYRFRELWWLGMVFWMAGMGTILFVRPKNERWHLLIAFYFVTALWLVVGTGSRWSIFDSRTTMRMTFWLAIPIYLHLHWIFPQPLRRLPKGVWMALYFAAVILALLQWFQVLPAALSYIGFLVALLGSIFMLIVHYIVAPDERRLVRNLALAVTVGLLPSAFLALMAARYYIPGGRFALVGVAFMIVIPIAYFYAAYRHHFADHNLRANRLLSLYLFMLLLSLVGIPTSAALLANVTFLADKVVITSIFMLATTLFSLLFFPGFQRLVEKYILLMPFAPEWLTHTYSARITTSLSFTGLADLLKSEILSSLLIHQSALLVRSETGWQSLYKTGVEEEALPTDIVIMDGVLQRAGIYHPVDPEKGRAPADRARVVLALNVGEKTVGCWLLGKRDPDDFYSASEIDMLQVLANQTAIAVVNIEQAERLRALYEANIDRHEIERAELAHTIHDEILRNLAILNNSLPDEAVTAEYEKAYSEVDINLRNMTSRLRPVMLDVSLYSALEEMADELEDRLDVSTAVIFDLPPSTAHYPEKVKEYLFRIAQNACENALRHAQAQCIEIAGALLPGHAIIIVRDDGISIANLVSLSDLANRKQFGLVGMHERAEIVGAKLSIDSTPGQGTEIKVEWFGPVTEEVNSFTG